MAENASFSPQQIVCLEHHHHHLYCEVIQLVESRNLCWVRPLFLAVLSKTVPAYHQLLTPKLLIDVRLTSDLLYPINLFRPALDTEVIPLLAQVESQDTSLEVIEIAKQQLHRFITQVWQDNTNKFS
ncbi:MAG: hypothetical protein AAGF26_13290 [Cyanobacteria bacterium P01_G01_bin.49]